MRIAWKLSPRGWRSRELPQQAQHNRQPCVGDERAPIRKGTRKKNRCDRLHVVLCLGDDVAGMTREAGRRYLNASRQGMQEPLDVKHVGNARTQG